MCCSLFRIVISVCCSCLASLAARSGVNQVLVSHDSVSKRRRWYANWLRLPGNLVLRFRAAPVRVLSNQEWIEREQQLAAATIVDGGLQLRKHPGIPLSDFLDSGESPAIKSQAIIAAVAALFEFHQQTGQSHGDASTMNVLIDQQTEAVSAKWFDFDVAHTGSCPILNRGDDLRAILSTAGVEEFEPSIREAYPDEEIWESAIALLANGTHDVFHLAQQKRISGSRIRQNSGS